MITFHWWPNRPVVAIALVAAWVCLVPAVAWGFQSDAEQVIDSAVKFLLAKQADDGAWHSEHYGAMKQGAANTSLILYALSHLRPDELQQHSEAIQRAAAFLQPGIKRNGCVANPEGSLDYPIYSTAMVLTVHKRIGLGLKPLQVEAMIKYLLDSQCTNQRGFDDQNPNQGGWDILGPGSTGGKTSGANVSVTFYVVEALVAYQATSDGVEAGVEKEKPGHKKIELSNELAQKVDVALAAASRWCQRIVERSPDGGFYFTSEHKSLLNKAGWRDKTRTAPLAYGTPTCDGLGVLLKLATEPDDNAVSRSVDWLENRPDVDVVPGFKSSADDIGWPSSLKFYYLAALSRSLSQFEQEKARSIREAITQQLVEAQLVSGAWKNDSSRMRENDVLIATPLGLIAILNCRPNSK